jgi:hypothetical protein
MPLYSSQRCPSLCGVNGDNIGYFVFFVVSEREVNK